MIRAGLTSTIVVIGLAFGAACASVPQGETGAAADELAKKVETFVGKSEWDATGAVSFGFRGTRNFVWDKQRGYLYVKKGDDEIWLDLVDKGGFAKRAGADVVGAELDKQLADAWAWFCNDTFWLNPYVKLFDEGAQRELVRDGDRKGIKITYGAGGVTPGDTYLWLVEDTGKPLAVKMWVSILPVKGAEFSWEEWVTLKTGAKIAKLHKGPMGATITIDDPAGAPTLAELEPGPDRFAKLEERRTAKQSSAVRPSSAE